MCVVDEVVIHTVSQSSLSGYLFFWSDEHTAGDAQYADFSGTWQERLDVLLYFHWLSGLMFVSAAGVTGYV